MEKSIKEQCIYILRILFEWSKDLSKISFMNAKINSNLTKITANFDEIGKELLKYYSTIFPILALHAMASTV